MVIEQRPDESRENYVDMLIKVDKKSKVKIGEIIVDGNKDFTDDQVRAAMKETKQRGLFRPLQPLGPLVVNTSWDIVNLRIFPALQGIESYFTDNYKMRIFKKF